MEPGRTRFGICDSCRHQRLIGNTRGSTFSLCQRSRDDPRYPRYPRVPVTTCPGHELKPDPEPVANSNADPTSRR